MNKLIIGLLLVITTTTVGAIELTLGGWSKHLGAPSGEKVCGDLGCHRVWDWKNYYNETHNTVAVRYRGFEVGTMVNSHFKRSYMVSWAPQWDANEYFSYGIRLGGVTGYIDRPVSLVVHPYMVVYYKAVGVELGWLPDMNSRHPYGILTLAGKVRF